MNIKSKKTASDYLGKPAQLQNTINLISSQKTERDLANIITRLNINTLTYPGSLIAYKVTTTKNTICNLKKDHKWHLKIKTPQHAHEVEIIYYKPCGENDTIFKEEIHNGKQINEHPIIVQSDDELKLAMHLLGFKNQTALNKSDKTIITQLLVKMYNLTLQDFINNAFSGWLNSERNEYKNNKNQKSAEYINQTYRSSEKTQEHLSALLQHADIISHITYIDFLPNEILHPQKTEIGNEQITHFKASSILIYKNKPTNKTEDTSNLTIFKEKGIWHYLYYLKAKNTIKIEQEISNKNIIQELDAYIKDEIKLEKSIKNTIYHEIFNLSLTKLIIDNDPDSFLALCNYINFQEKKLEDELNLCIQTLKKLNLGIRVHQHTTTYAPSGRPPSEIHLFIKKLEEIFLLFHPNGSTHQKHTFILLLCRLCIRKIEQLKKDSSQLSDSEAEIFIDLLDKLQAKKISNILKGNI